MILKTFENLEKQLGLDENVRLAQRADTERYHLLAGTDTMPLQSVASENDSVIAELGLVAISKEDWIRLQECFILSDMAQSLFAAHTYEGDLRLLQEWARLGVITLDKNKYEDYAKDKL